MFQLWYMTFWGNLLSACGVWGRDTILPFTSCGYLCLKLGGQIRPTTDSKRTVASTHSSRFICLAVAFLCNKNSAFCPQNAMLCFVYLRTKHDYLRYIKWLDFITKMGCVYCAVRPEYSIIIPYRTG